MKNKNNTSERIKWLEDEIDSHNDIIKSFYDLPTDQRGSVKEHREIIRLYHIELITLKTS